MYHTLKQYVYGFRLALRDKVGTGYVASTLALSASNLVAGFAILRWIGPENFGIWLHANIIRIWVDILRLGVPNGMNRELPSLLGAGKLAEARAIASTSLVSTAVAAALGCIVFLVLVTKASLQNEFQYALALGSAGMSWITNSYTSYLRGTYRSDSHFKILTFVQYSEAILTVISLTLVSEWGFVGLCVRGALISFAQTILLHLGRPLPVPFAFSRASLVNIWRSGMPQFVNSYVINFAGTADRAILLALPLGSSLAGLYAPALAVTSAVNTITGAINSYAYPKILRNFAASESYMSVRNASLNAIGISALCLLPFTISVCSIGPWVIENYFPAYNEGIRAMQIASLGGLFFAVRLATIVLIAFKAWREYATYAGMLLVCNWSFALIGSRWEDPLIGTAWAGVFASLLVAGVLLSCVSRAVKKCGDVRRMSIRREPS